MTTAKKQRFQWILPVFIGIAIVALFGYFAFISPLQEWNSLKAELLKDNPTISQFDSGMYVILENGTFLVVNQEGCYNCGGDYYLSDRNEMNIVCSCAFNVNNFWVFLPLLAIIFLVIFLLFSLNDWKVNVHGKN